MKKDGRQNGQHKQHAVRHVTGRGALSVLLCAAMFFTSTAFAIPSTAPGDERAQDGAVGGVPVAVAGGGLWAAEAGEGEVEEVRAGGADGLRHIVARTFDKIVFRLLADLGGDGFQGLSSDGLFRQCLGDFSHEGGPVTRGCLDGREEGGGRREPAFFGDHGLVFGSPFPDVAAIFRPDEFRDVVLVGVLVRREEAVLINGGLEVDMRWGGNGYLPFPDGVAAFEIDGEREEVLVFADGHDLVVDDAADFDAGQRCDQRLAGGIPRSGSDPSFVHEIDFLLGDFLDDRLAVFFLCGRGHAGVIDFDILPDGIVGDFELGVALFAVVGEDFLRDGFGHRPVVFVRQFDLNVLLVDMDVGLFGFGEGGGLRRAFEDGHLAVVDFNGFQMAFQLGVLFRGELDGVDGEIFVQFERPVLRIEGKLLGPEERCFINIFEFGKRGGIAPFGGDLDGEMLFDTACYVRKQRILAFFKTGGAEDEIDDAQGVSELRDVQHGVVAVVDEEVGIRADGERRFQDVFQRPRHS